MDPKKGSIGGKAKSKSNIRAEPRRSWLAHMPLWAVCGLGGLVMFASEEPEAARSPQGRTVVGAITHSAQQPNSVASIAGASLLPGVSLNTDPFSTLTDLGLVPPASRILDYPEQLALTNISPPSEASGEWLTKGPSPVRATPGLAALRHSYERRLAGDEGRTDASSIATAEVLDETFVAELPETLDTLITRIDAGRDAMADEITGSSDLIDLRHQQHKMADFLARYYRRSKDDIHRYIRYAYESGQRNGVDPYLILGIMCVESSLNPKATSEKDARGLMQVLVSAHTKRFKPFGGVERAYDPRVSVEIGTRIIAGMIIRTGSVKKALKYYVGAANFRTDAGYGNKVIGMREKVWAAANGKRIHAKPNIDRAIRRAESTQAKLKPVVITASR